MHFAVGVDDDGDFCLLGIFVLWSWTNLQESSVLHVKEFCLSNHRKFSSPWNFG